VHAAEKKFSEFCGNSREVAMAVNLKAAASLGVSLSDVFIARANEVRE
jgi:hypothetical protein